jgi:hypothetical protein
MQMTGHFIVKKIWGTKMYFTIKFERTIYVTCVLHFSHLSSNSTLTPQKKIQLGTNLSSIMQKKSLKTKL